MDIATDKTTTSMIAQGILAGTVVDPTKGMPTDKHTQLLHRIRQRKGLSYL